MDDSIPLGVATSGNWRLKRSKAPRLLVLDQFGCSTHQFSCVERFVAWRHYLRHNLIDRLFGRFVEREPDNR